MNFYIFALILIFFGFSHPVTAPAQTIPVALANPIAPVVASGSAQGATPKADTKQIKPTLLPRWIQFSSTVRGRVEDPSGMNFVPAASDIYYLSRVRLDLTLRPTPWLRVPDGGEMVLVRGSLLPILRLHLRFGVIPASEAPSDGVLIVVESARKKFCVMVDELIGKQEVVIKSLGETFKNVTGIAGGSILGDGRVGLILDVEALFGNPNRE